MRWQLLSLKLPPSPGAFGPSATSFVPASADAAVHDADDAGMDWLGELDDSSAVGRGARVREVSDASSEEWEQLRVDEAHTSALSPTASQWAGSSPEKVLHTAAVLKVSAGGIRGGRLDITARCLYFTPEAQPASADGSTARDGAGSCVGEVHDEQWALDWLREVHSRRYMLRQTALELFFGDGTTAFLNFPSKEEWHAAHSVLVSLKPPHVSEPFAAAASLLPPLAVFYRDVCRKALGLRSLLRPPCPASCHHTRRCRSLAWRRWFLADPHVGVDTGAAAAAAPAALDAPVADVADLELRVPHAPQHHRRQDVQRPHAGIHSALSRLSAARFGLAAQSVGLGTKVGAGLPSSSEAGSRA